MSLIPNTKYKPIVSAHKISDSIMVTKWKVLKEVARRYGSREEQFINSAEKLNDVRTGKMPLEQMEDSEIRKEFRAAREGVSLDTVLERIITSANFQDKCVLEKLCGLATAVCRLLKNGSPYGTGFLIAEDIIITNNHVIGTVGDAVEMLAEFNYEIDINNNLKPVSSFKLAPEKFFLTSSLREDKNIPFSGLDFTIIGVETLALNGTSISSFSPVKLDGNPGKVLKGESCVVIQHPNGFPKKVVLKDIAFFSETDTRLVYETATLPGSSGSMVIGLGTCEVIALHHSGLPKTDAQNRILTKSGTLADADTPDSEIEWLGNEGIKISKILQALKEADLPQSMQTARRKLLDNDEKVGRKLGNAIATNTLNNPIADNPSTNNNMASKNKENTSSMPSNKSTTTADFIFTAVYDAGNIAEIEAILTTRYGTAIKMVLMLPTTARLGNSELFTVNVPFHGNVFEEAKILANIPGIQFVEPDVPLSFNFAPSLPPDQQRITESDIIYNDGYGVPNEDVFKDKYLHDSDYVKAKTAAEYRRWNWAATAFDKFISSSGVVSPVEKGIRIVQFDTGVTTHSKIVGQFDLDHDHNFFPGEDGNDATDPRVTGPVKFPGHGTRTSSLLIGNDFTLIPSNGNCGLLTGARYKLTPYRIAETVILINRQTQLSAALDMALSQGFDIISLSMGISPTIATAHMARKAYEAGVIWCCAAGNEVQFVIAPAVFPGTIAVAASNPMDKDWRGSSRGHTVDITAPGEDVYVPIWKQGDIEDFAYGDGTSYATPHVAAAAAYWLAKYHDVLSSPNYAGWRRVEAFRQALKTSARNADNVRKGTSTINSIPNLPGGFGAGILDAKLLMNTPPLPYDQLEHAYNKWNENDFFASLQGWGEVIKTYWNILHAKIFGSRSQTDEAFTTSERMSELSAQMAESTFGAGSKRFEAAEALDKNTLIERLSVINNKIIPQSN